MPKYGWDINELLFEEDVKKIYDKANNAKEAALISLMWVSGARPAEMKELKKERVVYSTSKVSITLPTKKLGEAGNFKIKERTLEFDRPNGLQTNIYLETIIKYVSELPPDSLLFPHTTRWQEKTLGRLAMAAIGKQATPYHFRHSIMSWLAHNGATIDMLMHFKGAASVQSVSTYLHAKPFIVNLQNQRRSRNTIQDPPTTTV